MEIIDKNLDSIKSFAQKNNISLEEEISIHIVVSKGNLEHLFKVYLYLLNKGFKKISHRFITEETWNEEDVLTYYNQCEQIFNYI
jgi:sulfatase maturation enzyme AslB (radical SAM superfamily)